LSYFLVLENYHFENISEIIRSNLPILELNLRNLILHRMKPNFLKSIENYSSYRVYKETHKFSFGNNAENLRPKSSIFELNLRNLILYRLKKSFWKTVANYSSYRIYNEKLVTDTFFHLTFLHTFQTFSIIVVFWLRTFSSDFLA